MKILAFILPIMALMQLPAIAQDTPAQPLAKTVPAFQCTAETEGQLSCQAGKSCKCGFKPAEKATGLPDRWAWDCGITRPQCDVTPADSGGYGTELPAVIVETGDKDKKKKHKKDDN